MSSPDLSLCLFRGCGEAVAPSLAGKSAESLPRSNQINHMTATPGEHETTMYRHIRAIAADSGETGGRRLHRCLCRAMLSAALLAGLTCPAFALDLEQLWVANPDMIMEAAPMVVDLDGDGDAELLTAAYENLIVADGTGRELWRFDTRGRYATCPPILERPGQSPLIFAADNRGMFTCLDGAGQVVWQKDITPVFCTGPALADLTGDGSMEIVQGEGSGTIRALAALTGDSIWTAQTQGAPSCPAVADINGDGRQEIIFATTSGILLALNADGTTLWQRTFDFTTEPWHTCSPIIYGLSTGEIRIAASAAEMVYCLDPAGNIVWQQPTRGELASTLSAGDFDADGRADLFAVTQLGVLYRYDEEGRVLWDIDTQGRSLASGAIIDLDGDGALEYLLCTQQGNLLAFNRAGEVVYNHQFDNRTINETPAFGDLLPDRPGIEFVITGGESGQFFCFGAPAPVNTAAEWRTYRCDDHLTGAWFGLVGEGRVRMTPEDLTWDRVLTGGEVVFHISNPTAGALRADALCVRPDGSRQAAVGRVVGPTGVLQMPAGITAPGVYRFEWSLTDAGGERILADSRELTLMPYQNDQALARRAALAVRGVIGSEVPGRRDRDFRAALYGEMTAIKTEAAALAPLQAAVPGAAPAFVTEVNARTEALTERARRALALANVAPQILAAGPNTSFVPFEGITWENRDVDRQLPDQVTMPLRIERRSIPGEHEPVSVKLLNVTMDPIEVRGAVRSSSGGPAVTAFEMKTVPTNQGTVAWDPILPLGSRSITIPPLEAREVWIDVDLTGVAPGAHTVTTEFSAGRSRANVEVSLNVIPFEMAGFGQMRLCAWARYNDHAVADLLAHGNTVFVGELPHATVAEGSADVSIDFEHLGEFVERLRGHDAYLLLGGAPNLGVPMESDEYVTRLRDYFNRVFAFLAEHGIPESNVALYPYDEPGGAGWDTVNRYVAFGRQGLRARPGLKFYVNGGGDLAMFEALNEVASIWCPGYYMLPEQSAEMNFLRASGKTLWSYDCGYAYARPIGPNTKTINVAGQYRMAAVFGFNNGGTGIGYWCYNSGETLWGPTQYEYSLVYVNEDGTSASSRRWEAVREGMEDARILIALREKLTDDSVAEPVKARIRHLLEVTVPQFSGQSLEEVRVGAARYVLDATNNDASVSAFRSEMMDCVEALR